MNLIIDSGNTRIKAASFEGEVLVNKWIFSHADELTLLLSKQIFENIIVSSVSKLGSQLLSEMNARGKKILLTHSLALPVHLTYHTPETLGVDRIAAVCGAMLLFPKKNCLVIDAGTCITYDFIDAEGTYPGGGISPGISMRFSAMQHFTSRLPLGEAVELAPLVGNSTITALQSGVMNGVVEEIKGIIHRYQQEHAVAQVILCGGDAHFFENIIKPSIFVAPDLVLIGLNRILLHNVPS